MKFKPSKAFGFVMIGLALAAAHCASLGSARHVAAVSVTTMHGTLSVIQDTENALACGRPTAPQSPQCVPIETHRAVSQLLSKAFALEIDVAKVVRGLPVGAPQPREVVNELQQISKLVSDVLALMPSSPGKTTLVQNLGGK
jgi:hypothetical protein